MRTWTLRTARKSDLLVLLSDGKPHHVNDLRNENSKYYVSHELRHELLRELVADGLVETRRCTEDRRRRDYRRIPHPWELETAHLWPEIAGA